MMNLDNFQNSLPLFLENDRVAANIDIGGMPGVDSDFIECIQQLGGRSFGEGIYRVFSFAEVPDVTRLVEEVFIEYAGNVTVFGCDWLGRFFAVDDRRIVSGKANILMLETGAGEAMQIPLPIKEFHTRELVEYKDDALAAKFFSEWKAISSDQIDLSSCVGYKVPLFLGGPDKVENLELIDREFYTQVCGQLRHKVLQLSNGQSVGQVKFEN